VWTGLDEFSGLRASVYPATLRGPEPPGRASSPGLAGTAANGQSFATSLTGEAAPSGRDLVAALASLGDRSIGGAQVFGTWTFRDLLPDRDSPGYTSVGHGGGVRAMEGYLRGLAEVYPGVAAFVAMEPHQDRVAPHFHGLLGGLDPDVPAAIDAGRRRRPGPTGRAAGGGLVTASVGARHARERIWQEWYDRHGMARLESVDGDGSALYVAKYSLKGGDVVPWWAIWEPGQLRNEWVAASQHRGHR
jgi:hypothetical protein